MPKPKIVSLPFDSSWVDFNDPAGALFKRLKRYADPWYAHFVGSALPKNSCPVLGVRVAPIRQTVKEILAAGGERFLNAVLYPPKTGRGAKRGSRPSLDYCEARIAAAFLIGQAKISFDKRLDAVLAFLPLLDSWLLCDTLAGAIKPKASENTTCGNSSVSAGRSSRNTRADSRSLRRSSGSSIKRISPPFSIGSKKTQREVSSPTRSVWPRRGSCAKRSLNYPTRRYAISGVIRSTTRRLTAQYRKSASRGASTTSQKRKSPQ